MEALRHSCPEARQGRDRESIHPAHMLAEQGSRTSRVWNNNFFQLEQRSLVTFFKFIL